MPSTWDPSPPNSLTPGSLIAGLPRPGSLAAELRRPGSLGRALVRQRNKAAAAAKERGQALILSHRAQRPPPPFEFVIDVSDIDAVLQRAVEDDLLLGDDAHDASLSAASGFGLIDLLSARGKKKVPPPSVRRIAEVGQGSLMVARMLPVDANERRALREAVRAAWEVVSAGGGGGSAVDAVVAGCSACEVLRCDGTVGPGGSPDENGETTLDALIMNGATMEIGAVAAMRYVKDGIKAAKLVMEHTKHTLLVGEKATAFAISMGLAGPTNLSSPESIEKWTNWRQNHCQPSFWKNAVPVGTCGPYHPIKGAVEETQGHICQGWFQSDNLLEPINSHLKFVNRHNHDTISMTVIDKMGHVAVGTSTNGAIFKIPGRVGDGPIPGSSSYGDDEVGACGATGDGDIMMRFLPCYQVVESMRRGVEPRDAAMDAISRIARKFPDFVGAVFAINKKGVHAGACHGWTFQYSVRNSSMQDVEVITVEP